MDSEVLPQWIKWSREIQSIAQSGLKFNENGYDRERYKRLSEIAAEITATYSNISFEKILLDFNTQLGYSTPKVEVRGAVIENGKILLVQDAIDKRWCMPGGWADVGSSPREMVIREVKEESGYDIFPKKLIGIFDANREMAPLEFYHAYKIVFLCEVVGGSPATSQETLSVQFFEIDNYPPLSKHRTSERHLKEAYLHSLDVSRPIFFD